MAVQQHRNLVVSRMRKRVVDVVNSVAKVVDLDEFSRNSTLGSGDCDRKGFSSDSLEVVGLGLGSDGELEVLNESVFVGSSFFDVDGVRRFGDGVVPEGDVDGVFAVFVWAVCDVVGSVVVVDDFSGHISVGTNDLDFEGITSFAHVVAIAISGFDVEEGRLGVEDIFETLSPDQRVGGVRSGFDGNVVGGVLDVIEVEGFLGVEDDINLVVSGIDGLVVDSVGTILVVNDLGGNFITDRVEDLRIDWMSSSCEWLAFVVLGDNRESGKVGGVSSFQTGSEDVEFGRIRIGITAIDCDIPWAS